MKNAITNRISHILFFFILLIITPTCTQKGFEWQAEAHTKDLDRKKGFKQKKHRANYHKYNQHHKKHK